ncbi:hypothetical protein [Aureimonas ureilytica]|uniref:hypothetical protein n=1 Tax=Aureimonas ureilytica TaxID=401562 RepID=UPI00037AC9E8|nr:hypothetical protein [Aureimonas ureilytica]
MTHSHDTATPALSVESEEAVAAALWQEEAREGTPKSIWQARTLEAFRDTADINQERWRRFARAALAAAPAPNPSPAAKGGDAGALAALYQTILKMPRRREPISGQTFSYVQLDEVLAHVEQAAALATPSLQPADAVREALFSAWELDELRRNASAKHLVYLAHHAGVGLKANEVEAMERWGALCNKLAALASDPAPAGEAVEPVAWVIPGDDNANADGWIDCRADRWGEFTRPLYAHPDPEAARLREDLERVTRVAELLGESFEANKTALVSALRERDDARKALETAEGEIDRLVSALHEIENLWLAPGHDSLKVMRAKDIARAARSASREGASDE